MCVFPFPLWWEEGVFGLILMSGEKNHLLWTTTKHMIRRVYKNCWRQKNQNYDAEEVQTTTKKMLYSLTFLYNQRFTRLCVGEKHYGRK